MVKMTVREVLDLDLWGEVCDAKGWSVQSINQGHIKLDDEIKFDKEILGKSTRYQNQDIKKWLSDLSVYELKNLSREIAEEIISRL